MKLIILFTLFCNLSFAALNEVDKTHVFNKNLLLNGGFENSKAAWTASAGTFAVTTTSPLVGLVHATWDAAASGNTLTSSAVAIPVGMRGRNGVASCVIVTPSGTATHEIQAYDGSNILAEATVVSSTSATRASVNFPFPSSGNIQLRIYANADEPSVSLDDCYLGPAEGYNLENISQTSLAGESYWAGTTSCTHSRASATYGAFTSAAACPGPTITTSAIGTWLTTDADRLVQTVQNLPPGRYVAEFEFGQYTGSSAVTGLTIYDGSAQCDAASAGETSSSSGSNVKVSCTFTYTTAQSSKSFELYGAAVGGATINLYGAQTSPAVASARFRLTRHPLSSEQAYRPDMYANSWSGYHDATCSWARNNAAYGSFTADASCAMVERTNMNFGTVSASGSVLPAITFTPKRAGRYYVCANANVTLGTVPANNQLRLYDGATTIAESAIQGVGSGADYRNTTPVCGIYVAASIASVTIELQGRGSANFLVDSGGANSTVEWSIIQISQNIPAPALVNSVVSSSSGIVKIVSAFVTNSGTPTVTRQDGSWISSLTDNGTGDVTVNFTAGTFSTTPNCFCNGYNSTGAGLGCSAISSTAASSSLTRFITYSSSTASAIDRDFYVMCIGAP